MGSGIRSIYPDKAHTCYAIVNTRNPKRIKRERKAFSESEVDADHKVLSYWIKFSLKECLNAHLLMTFANVFSLGGLVSLKVILCE